MKSLEKNSNYIKTPASVKQLCIYLVLFAAFIISCNSDAAPHANKAIDFQYILYDSENTTVDFSTLYNKPIILNFWAGLCPPCRAEMPDFQLFHEQYGSQVTVIGIDVGEYTGLGSKKDALQLIDQLNVNYLIGGTSESNIIELYEVYGLPTTVFIDSDQNIIRTWSGAVNLEKLRDIGLSMIESSQ